VATDARPARPPSVNELLDLYLDGLDVDERLSVKTRFDYRKNADAYVRPLLGAGRLRDVAAETLLKNGKPLAPNTIRLARARLAGRSIWRFRWAC
jgi:hypothetical protein